MPFAKCRVLIVEDDRDSRDALFALLARLGHDVRAVGTAGDALAAVRQGGLDAILLDIVLPDESGLVVLQEIRRREMPLKVAVITSLDPSRIPAQAGVPGPDLVMTKPLDAFALVGWLGSCAPR